jgi:hypothetical protein
MSGDSGDVQPSCAVFEEGQCVEAVAESGVEVEEVDCDDALGLVGEELSPCLAGPARSWIDSGGVEYFPDGRGADLVPEAGQFALNPPMSPAGVFLG